VSRQRGLLVIPGLILSFACVTVHSGFSLGPENNGATKAVTVGSEVRLVLPGDLEWNIWNFDVKQAGDFVLRATGDAPCRRDTPPCASPTVRYEFKVRAR